jgi:HicB family
MPPELHAEVARAADGESVSLNQFITSTLAGAVGWDGQAAPAERKPASGTKAGASDRLVNFALAANLVVVTVAGVVAIALLVVALRAL